MAFYKVNYSKLSKKYHPTAKTIGTISMRQLAKRLSDRSTVTISDAYAVLAEIGDVMAEYMAAGYSVELQGLGNFRYTIDSSKCGEEKAEDVTAGNIKGVRIRFVAETTRNADHSVATRTGIPESVKWNLWGAEEDDPAAGADDDDATGSSASGGNNDDGNNPL